MIEINLQLFGGRGADSGLPESFPGGGGGGRPSGMDAQPGVAGSAAEALGEKGRPMSTANAVSGANPYYSLGPEYQNNCQRCVIATEARFRGYDTMALPTYDDDPMPMGDNFLGNFVGAKSHNVSRSTARAAQNDIESYMKGQGDGSRGIMALQWKGGKTGHVVNVVQRNGKTYYYDGQDGTKINAKALFGSLKTKSGLSITRVDNLEFSSTVNQAVRQR